MSKKRKAQSPDASSKMMVRAYSVREFGDDFLMSAIAKTIAQQVAQNFWVGPQEQGDLENPSAQGTIVPYFLNTSLIIRATPDVHDRIAKKMDFWRQALREGISIQALFGEAMERAQSKSSVPSIKL